MNGVSQRIGVLKSTNDDSRSRTEETELEGAADIYSQTGSRDETG